MPHKITFPKVIAVELPESHLVDPFSGHINPATLDQFLKSNYYGVVSAKGKWKIEAAAGWTVERPEVGTYKVTHSLGYSNLSLHVSLLEQPGSMSVVFHTPTFFMVETHRDREPTNLDWMFSLTRVVSQPAPQDDQTFDQISS